MRDTLVFRAAGSTSDSPDDEGNDRVILPNLQGGFYAVYAQNRRGSTKYSVSKFIVPKAPLTPYAYDTPEEAAKVAVKYMDKETYELQHALRLTKDEAIKIAKDEGLYLVKIGTDHYSQVAKDQSTKYDTYHISINILNKNVKQHHKGGFRSEEGAALYLAKLARDDIDVLTQETKKRKKEQNSFARRLGLNDTMSKQEVKKIAGKHGFDIRIEADKYVGVTRRNDAKARKYQAATRKQGHIGVFEYEYEAAIAVAMAKKNWGRYRRGTGCHRTW